MTKQIVLVVAPPMVPLTPVVAQPDLSFIEGSTDRGRLPQSFDLGDPGLENQVAYFLSPDLSELQDGDIVLGIDVALATEDDNSMMAAEVSRPASLAGRETAARNDVRPSSAPVAGSAGGNDPPRVRNEPSEDLLNNPTRESRAAAGLLGSIPARRELDSLQMRGYRSRFSTTLQAGIVRGCAAGGGL